MVFGRHFDLRRLFRHRVSLPMMVGPAALALVIALVLCGGVSTVAQAKPTPPPTVTCTLSGTLASGSLTLINATPDASCGTLLGDCGGTVGSNPDFHCFGPVSCSAYKTVSADLSATGSAVQAIAGCFTAPNVASDEATCTTNSTCSKTKHGNLNGSLGCVVAWPLNATGTFTANCTIP
jgi:hypothetical protein